MHILKIHIGAMEKEKGYGYGWKTCKLVTDKLIVSG
jgi:hypothetical protein